MPCLEGSGDPYNPFEISHSNRSQLLEAKFSEFNELYFGSELPKYRVRLCSKPKSYGHEIAGYCLTKGKNIMIRNGMGRKSTLQTLVHEMAHAKLSALENGEVHGRQFVRELRRLRKLGAPLSPLDVDRQHNKQTHVLTRQNIEKLIEEALVIEGVPKRSVPKFLERELALPISVIDTAVSLKSAIDDTYARTKKANFCW